MPRIIARLGCDIGDRAWTRLVNPSGNVAGADKGWRVPDSPELGYRFHVRTLGKHGAARLEVFHAGVSFGAVRWQHRPNDDCLVP